MATTTNTAPGGDPDRTDDVPPGNIRRRSAGVLPFQDLKALISAGKIVAEAKTPILEGQIQPASLDLRLGETAYRVRASFLTG
ncbi:MAG: 2'-deoxycytidine 5'-triphosphate deaminase, partial [Pseudomonadota bacterium]